MPNIYDNIESHLLPRLHESLALARCADFCVGYFNLRGWKAIDHHLEAWSGGAGHCCRLLVGMHTSPDQELRQLLARRNGDPLLDMQTAARLKKKLANEFRDQLTVGVPTNADEAGLRRLARQIHAGQVVVKLFLAHHLHAKLYLFHRDDPINPVFAYLGSSNLTFAGLSGQGELNVDVHEPDAAQKLVKWFDDRWNDPWCIDISKELAQIIEESWAREEPIPPYHIYVKMAYHLSQDARAGLSQYGLPPELDRELFDFQKAAVKIAAHHVKTRGGVVIGDVVGLGKTLMATALAQVFEHDYDPLIICPKNLVPMWDDYREKYRLRGRVLSLSRVMQELPNLRRYQLVLIDESHNLRNREGKRYRAIQEYVQRNESKCVLLSATPYNKTYLDLGAQLRLFVPEDKNLGMRPEQLLREMGEVEFRGKYQADPRSLAAFEKSPYADDWRELMRLFMVRRTRTFIQENYAEVDPDSGRKFLRYADGRRSYFPVRVPKTLKFRIAEGDEGDQYARMYSPDVVDTITALKLPRYGLGNYKESEAALKRAGTTADERKLFDNLGRAGQRLIGFSRTNLFKRLESSGAVFLQSIERHLLRNYVFLHAIENGLPLPIGTQDLQLLDARDDRDMDELDVEPVGDEANGDDEEVGEEEAGPSLAVGLRTEAALRKRAGEIYQQYATTYKRRFKWLRPALFTRGLAQDLADDATHLLGVMMEAGEWDARRDVKLAALVDLVKRQHPGAKVLVFTQFADTVDYLVEQLRGQGVWQLAGATGAAQNPTELAWRFSPVSNGKRAQVQPEDELRVLVATDVLSEGQNLQDCAVVVNYDLPWAIIRLIQRAGRVDRIGQNAENILAYTFLPADGVERIIRLRARVRQRLKENAEVVGTDEAFFEDEMPEATVHDLYNEKAGILDADTDGEVDLASYAYQIWKNATDADKRLASIIPSLPAVAYSTRSHLPRPDAPEGALVYMRTAEGTDALAWIDAQGRSVTESQFEILKAAACTPDTPAVERLAEHHELVTAGVALVQEQEKQAVGGQLGRPSGARYRTYHLLKRHVDDVKGSLFDTPELRRAIDAVYAYPLRSGATDTLNRLLRTGATDQQIAETVVDLYERDALSLRENDEGPTGEPKLICSMGLRGIR